MRFQIAHLAHNKYAMRICIAMQKTVRVNGKCKCINQKNIPYFQFVYLPAYKVSDSDAIVQVPNCPVEEIHEHDLTQ